MLSNDDAGPRPDARVRADGGPDDEEVDAMPADAEGPTVTVTSPDEPAAGDFDSDAILVSATFVATCTVARNESSGTPIDSSSVVMKAIAGGSSKTVAAVPSGVADTYTANFDLTGFPNGEVEIRCTASDLGDPVRSNTDQIATYLDLGPRIDVFSPVAGASYGQQVDVSFTATAQPVATGDTGAAVDDVVLTVGGVVVPVTPTGGGSYFATVDFDDGIFDPQLDGVVGIAIEAVNSRTASAVSRTIDMQFVADSDGPTISISAPDPGQVIGGFMTITASVSDPAGVSAVIARIAHQYEVAMTRNGSTFTGTFDTRLLPNAFVFPLIEVVSLDAVGNESGVGRIVTLDNRPPLVALDPPSIREARCMEGQACPPAGGPMECSAVFDPLGTDATNDLQSVGQLFELRARIEDQGNGPLQPTNDVFIPHAGVDQGHVQIFLLDDQALPLLVDLDSDGTCDDINPAISPTSFPTANDEAAVASLIALGDDGDAPFPPDIGPLNFELGGDPNVPDDQCLAPLEPDDEPPTALCPLTSPVTRIIKGLDDTSAIFTLAPATNTVCMGNPFDAPATHIADGWACVAVRAQDNLGNMRVSPPMRLCIDSDGDGFDELGNDLVNDLGCAALGDVAVDGPGVPTCTDGCTPAQSFKDLSGYQLPIRF